MRTESDHASVVALPGDAPSVFSVYSPMSRASGDGNPLLVAWDQEYPIGMSWEADPLSVSWQEEQKGTLEGILTRRKSSRHLMGDNSDGDNKTRERRGRRKEKREETRKSISRAKSASGRRSSVDQKKSPSNSPSSFQRQLSNPNLLGKKISKEIGQTGFGAHLEKNVRGINTIPDAMETYRRVSFSGDSSNGSNGNNSRSSRSGDEDLKGTRGKTFKDREEASKDANHDASKNIKPPTTRTRKVDRRRDWQSQGSGSRSSSARGFSSQTSSTRAILKKNSAPSRKKEVMTDHSGHGGGFSICDISISNVSNVSSITGVSFPGDSKHDNGDDDDDSIDLSVSDVVRSSLSPVKEGHQSRTKLSSANRRSMQSNQNRTMKALGNFAKMGDSLRSSATSKTSFDSSMNMGDMNDINGMSWSESGGKGKVMQLHRSWREASFKAAKTTPSTYI